MKTIISEILSYYHRNRRVGHTKAISEIENVLIIIGDECQLKFASPTIKLMNFQTETTGLNTPIVFDNSAIVQLLTASINT